MPPQNSDEDLNRQAQSRLDDLYSVNRYYDFSFFINCSSAQACTTDKQAVN